MSIPADIKHRKSSKTDIFKKVKTSKHNCSVSEKQQKYLASM